VKEEHLTNIGGALQVPTVKDINGTEHVLLMIMSAYIPAKGLMDHAEMTLIPNPQLRESGQRVAVGLMHEYLTETLMTLGMKLITCIICGKVVPEVTACPTHMMCTLCHAVSDMPDIERAANNGN
jgi:hypothetical protein